MYNFKWGNFTFFFNGFDENTYKFITAKMAHWQNKEIAPLYMLLAKRSEEITVNLLDNLNDPKSKELNQEMQAGNISGRQINGRILLRSGGGGNELLFTTLSHEVIHLIESFLDKSLFIHCIKDVKDREIFKNYLLEVMKSQVHFSWITKCGDDELRAFVGDQESASDSFQLRQKAIVKQYSQGCQEHELLTTAVELYLAALLAGEHGDAMNNSITAMQNAIEILKNKGLLTD